MTARGPHGTHRSDGPHDASLPADLAAAQHHGEDHQAIRVDQAVRHEGPRQRAATPIYCDIV